MAEEERKFFVIDAENPINRAIPQGQVVEIEIKYGLFAGQYKSRVMDFTQKSIKLLPPKVDKQTVQLWEKTKVHINYMRPDAMYTFSGRVTKFEMLPREVLMISIPEQIERVQRRRYVRVDCKFPIRFRLASEESALDDSGESWHDGFCPNLSAGGMRLDNPKVTFEKGEVLELDWNLEGFHYQKVIAEIVRSITITKGDKEKGTEQTIFSFGLNFIQIHRVQKEKVITYVFKREREMIAGGVK